jgi:glycosyltransferase involved in cell wall biosynthesis
MASQHNTFSIAGRVSECPPDGSASVAVVILTFNEEANLPAALDSVKNWATEVFVVDSYSTDGTVEIALSRADDGVRVVQHEFVNYSDQWNWALTHLPIAAEWTLKLDADERVTEEFKAECTGRLANFEAGSHGVMFRRRLFFMDDPLRFGGVRSNYDLRMWRSGKARFEDRAVNERAIVEGNSETFATAIEHHDYKSLTDWLAKHNRYASMEAITGLEGNLDGEIAPRLFGSPMERRCWLRRFAQRLPLRHVCHFLFRYILLRGVLDGRAGFRYAFLHVSYMYWIDLKILEARNRGRPPAVVFPQRGRPHAAVEQSAIQQQCDRKHAERQAA